MKTYADILVESGKPVPTTTQDWLVEAAKTFRSGAAGSPLARYQLFEAMSSSDFPILLGKGFEVEAIAAQKDAVKEFDGLVHETTVPDFRPKKLRDLFGNTYFENVAEGEEYKADALAETELEIRATKFGRRFQYTWELVKNGDFTAMADFPKRLGNGATNTENREIAEVFVNAEGPRADYFGSVDNKPLTFDSVKAARKSLSGKKNHRGEPVDLSDLVLVVPATLEDEANDIVAPREIKTTATNAKGEQVETTQANPLSGKITVLVSKEISRINKSAKSDATWFLLPGKGTDNPALLLARMIGHEQVDIRVKRDQGERVGGGAVAFDEGSYKDDTVDYRGRHVFGTAKGFTSAVYASTGS